VQVADNVQVNVKPFSRDTYITVQLSAEELLEGQPAQVEAGAASEVKALKALAPAAEADRPSEVQELAGLTLVLPQHIGVVKASDFTGTRVHIEFALLNSTDQLVAIRAAHR
jgi:hypothetical protein